MLSSCVFTADANRNNGVGCVCCNYTGIRSSPAHFDGAGGISAEDNHYNFDCICQHSCSSSISSLGSPGLNNMEEERVEDTGLTSSSKALSRATTGFRTNNTMVLSTVGVKTRAQESVHHEVTNCCNNNTSSCTPHQGIANRNDFDACIADDENTGDWDQYEDDSSSSFSDDTLPTIDMDLVEKVGRGDAGRRNTIQPTALCTGTNSRVRDIPAYVQFFPVSMLTERPTSSQQSMSSLSTSSSSSSLSSTSSRISSSTAKSENEAKTTHNNNAGMLCSLPYSTSQMIQKAAQHRTKIMTVIKAPRQHLPTLEGRRPEHPRPRPFMSRSRSALVALKTPKRLDRFTTSFIPAELVTRTTSFLDVKSLLNLRVTCRVMRDLASRDEAGWVDACRRLWKSKVNICPEAVEMIEARGQRQRRKKKRRKLKSAPSSTGNGRLATRQSYGAMGAFRVSTTDAKERDTITIDELCYDGNNFRAASSTYVSGGATTDVLLRKRRSYASILSPQPEDAFCSFSGHDFHGPVWSFRFKETAGPDWTAWDPWWDGEKARTMVFLRDGTVKQIVPLKKTDNVADPGARLHDEDSRIHEEDRANGYVLRPAFSDGLEMTGGSNVRDATAGEGVGLGHLRHSNRRPKIEIRWRFVSDPMDMPSRPEGAYIRLTVGNRDVPTYVVRRSPTGNWGFLLESCWGVYASFELPRNVTFSHQGPARAPNGARMRLRRTRDGGRWMNVNGIESDEEEDDYTDSVNSAALLDDAAMVVTNEKQWREALLYNHGAVTLPEGRTDFDDLNRIFN